VLFLLLLLHTLRVYNQYLVARHHHHEQILLKKQQKNNKMKTAILNTYHSIDRKDRAGKEQINS
jgi:hypothetical protein